MNSQYRKIYRELLALMLLLGLLAPGCVTRDMAARMIVKAPNQVYTPPAPKKLASFWNHFSDEGNNNPFIYMKVMTGPPEAELALVELPPRDYHVKFLSTIHTNFDGKKFLNMKFLPETNGTFTPLKEPATIVILHGYMMYKELMSPWATMLAQAGYRVVLVDLRGHGKSTGDEVTYGKYETKDLMQMLDYLKAQGLCDEKVGVLGLSYGATLAMHWSAADARVKAVVAIAPYNNPVQAAERLAKELKIPISTNVLHEALAVASDRLDLKWRDWSGEAGIKKMKEPVLLIGGGRDRICLPADMDALKKAAPAGTVRLQVPEANHFVVGFWLPELAAPVKAWFQTQLNPAEATSVPIAMGKYEVKSKPN